MDLRQSLVKKAHHNAQTINASISKRYFEIQKAVAELEEQGQIKIIGGLYDVETGLVTFFE